MPFGPSATPKGGTGEKPESESGSMGRGEEGERTMCQSSHLSLPLPLASFFRVKYWGMVTPRRKVDNSGQHQFCLAFARRPPSQEFDRGIRLPWAQTSPRQADSERGDVALNYPR